MRQRKERQRKKRGGEEGERGGGKKPGKDRAKWIPRRFIKIIKF